MKRLFMLAGVATLAAVAGVAAPAGASNARVGVVSGSSAGLVGCLQDTQFTVDCLVAVEEPGGLHVVFESPGPSTGSLVTDLVSQTQYVEDVILPASALTVTGGTGSTAVRLVADLPRTGHLDISAAASSSGSEADNLTGCSTGYFVRYAFVGSGSARVAGGLTASGSIGGLAARGLGCDSFYLGGGTTGAWTMLTPWEPVGA